MKRNHVRWIALNEQPAKSNCFTPMLGRCVLHLLHIYTVICWTFNRFIWCVSLFSLFLFCFSLWRNTIVELLIVPYSNALSAIAKKILYPARSLYVYSTIIDLQFKRWVDGFVQFCYYTIPLAAYVFWCSSCMWQIDNNIIHWIATYNRTRKTTLRNAFEQHCSKYWQVSCSTDFFFLHYLPQRNSNVVNLIFTIIWQQ